MADLRKRKVDTEEDKLIEKQTASGTESDHVSFRNNIHNIGQVNNNEL